MRRKIGLAISVAVVALALMVPAPTLALDPYGASIRRNKCVLAGGEYGWGYVRFKVEQREWGKSGTNYFKAKSKLQYRALGSSTWHTQYTNPWASESFADDSETWSWMVSERYDFSEFEALNYYHRIRIVLEWWDQRSGPDVLLRSQTLTSKSC